FHRARCGDGIDRGPAADHADVEGRLRSRRDFDVGDSRNGAAQSMDRIGNSEGAVTVPARPLVGDSIAMAADRTARRAEPCAVDRYEVVDLPLHLVAEEVAHSP